MKLVFEDLDLDAAYLFNTGKNTRAYEFLGPHKRKNGTSFTLWAPNAQKVELVGDFNKWGEKPIELKHHKDQDMFQVTVLGTKKYDAYKYKITNKNGSQVYKADPFAFHNESPPHFNSKIFYIEDLPKPKIFQPKQKPMNIYEVNLASWKKYQDGNYLSYEKLAQELVDYVHQMGYTHMELMPIMEHPYDGSWGYQITGFFAPTSRFGDPKGFFYLVEKAHEKGIEVILDWVPSHYCKDNHGLRYFDGGAVFESPDPYFAENRIWDTMAFDLTKPQVRSFLFSSAQYFKKVYGVDGIRVDAVAYMLYKDFGEKEVDLEDPNNYRQEAIDFLKDFNLRIQEDGFYTIAEESSNFPQVTHPIDQGGLGFTYKWNMGWMHDILTYMKLDPLARSGYHHALTFPLMYAFNENYILPFSHDEVVHMKGSLLNKMPGSMDDKYKQVRLLMMYMMAHPGKKLSFMGAEFGQRKEWDEFGQLEWEILQDQAHKDHKKFIQSLNRFYLENKSLWDNDRTYQGFEWVDVDNSQESILAFKRKSQKEEILVVLNFTPVERKSYPFFVEEGEYQVIFSSSNRPSQRISTQEVSGNPALLVDLLGFEGIYLKKKSRKGEKKE